MKNIKFVIFFAILLQTTNLQAKSIYFVEFGGYFTGMYKFEPELHSFLNVGINPFIKGFNKRLKIGPYVGGLWNYPAKSIYYSYTRSFTIVLGLGILTQWYLFSNLFLELNLFLGGKLSRSAKLLVSSHIRTSFGLGVKITKILNLMAKGGYTSEIHKQGIGRQKVFENGLVHKYITTKKIYTFNIQIALQFLF